TFGLQRLKSAPETAACHRILRRKTDSSKRGAGHQRLYVFMSKCRSVAPGKERRRKNKRLKGTEVGGLRIMKDIPVQHSQIPFMQAKVVMRELQFYTSFSYIIDLKVLMPVPWKKISPLFCINIVITGAGKSHCPVRYLFLAAAVRIPSALLKAQICSSPLYIVGFVIL